MKHRGFEWKLDGDYYTTTVDSRFHPLTWRFGSIHQAKVMVDYNGEEVGICLSACTTRRKAMSSCLNWIKEYKKEPPQTIEKLFSNCYVRWPSIYETRAQVLNHLFFVIGNGYSWFDGVLFDTSPHAYAEYVIGSAERRIERLETEIELAKLYEELSNMVDLPADIRALFTKPKREEEDPTRPLPDDGKDIDFYPIYERYSNICRIPDDVKQGYLDIAIEAATLLVTRSKKDVKDKNIKIGKKILEDLEKRFPGGKAKSSV